MDKLLNAVIEVAASAEQIKKMQNKLALSLEVAEKLRNQIINERTARLELIKSMEGFFARNEIRELLNLREDLKNVKELNREVSSLSGAVVITSVVMIIILVIIGAKLFFWHS